MICPISQKIPEVPVVTPQGYCYEQRLLEEHRKTHGDVDPVSGESFDPEKLIVLQPSSTPAAEVESFSMTQLLSKVQNEFDILLLQNFKLRTALDSMKGQLSQSLYQHDAACRVVARLTRERDLWKNRIASAPASTPASETTTGFTAEKLNEISENAVDLQTARKAKTIAQYPVEDLKKWSPVSSAVSHEAARPGVTDLAIKEQPGRGNVIVTSGEDGHITMTSLSTMSRITRFQGSEKAATCVDVHPDADVIVAGFSDKTLRFYTGATVGDDLSFSTHKVARAHTAAVKTIEIHPLGDFVMTGGDDNKIVFTDIDTGNYMGPALEDKNGLSALKFHPDGNIFISGGRDGGLGVWDIRDMNQKMRFQATNGNESISSVQVGENGYYLSTADSSGVMKVWDLRKFQPNQTNTPISQQSVVEGVSKTPFSLSMATHNSLIACVGANSEGEGIVRVGSLAKKAKEITFGDALTGHKELVTRCMFVPNNNELVTVSKDNTVMLWRQE